MAVGGCHSSVAERWQLKPEALGLTPGAIHKFIGTTTVSHAILIPKCCKRLH